MASIGDIRTNLDKGFSVHNFQTLIKMCMEMAKVAPEPLVFYVLASVFDDLFDNWNQRQVMKEEAEEVQSRLLDKIRKVLTCIELGQDTEKINNSLNNLLRKFLQKT